MSPVPTKNRVEVVRACDVIPGVDNFAEHWPKFCVTPAAPKHLKKYWEALCLVILGPSSMSPETRFCTAFYFVEMNIKENIKKLLTEKGIKLKARKVVLFKLEIKIKNV